MPTLILTIFLLQLVIHLVNTIGASTINELLWTLYASLPSLSSSKSKSPSSSQKSQRTLKSEILTLKRSLAATSAQDNFAKWARLRREHDKKVQEYDDIVAKETSSKSKFTTYASVLRWVCTNGLRLFLQFRYARHAVFWVPRGWLVPAPWLLGRIVGFPMGVRSSSGEGGVGGEGAEGGAGVSVQVWGWVCVVVIGVAAEAVAWGVQRVVEMRRGNGKGKGEGMKMKMKMGVGRGEGEAETERSGKS